MIEGSSRIFETGGASMSGDNGQKALIDKLYRKIGEVEVENDWFKKSSVVKPEGSMGFCRSGSWVFGCKTA